ncbi:MAG: hypothetical protein AB1508_07845 [Pseudomonadota bacterium]
MTKRISDEKIGETGFRCLDCRSFLGEDREHHELHPRHIKRDAFAFPLLERENERLRAEIEILSTMIWRGSVRYWPDIPFFADAACEANG